MQMGLIEGTAPSNQFRTAGVYGGRRKITKNRLRFKRDFSVLADLPAVAPKIQISGATGKSEKVK